MRIELDHLADPDVVAFLEGHVAELRSLSPPESTHTLDLAALRADDVRCWVAREDATVVGCVALKILDGHHAELKSMRTAPHRTRQGIATRLLLHVLDAARVAGITRVSLETGSQDFFGPARALYSRYGFVECGPFATYRPDLLSTFMTRSV